VSIGKEKFSRTPILTLIHRAQKWPNDSPADRKRRGKNYLLITTQPFDNFRYGKLRSYHIGIIVA
jgi:hypothetical protein